MAKAMTAKQAHDFVAEMEAAESEGRALHKAGWPCPRYTKRSRPKQVAKARGWLLEANKLHGGGWGRSIPPLPVPLGEVQDAGGQAVER